LAQYADTKVRITLDVVLFVLIIFQAGITWQNMQYYERRLTALEAQSELRVKGFERLASVEATLIQMQGQLNRIETRINDREASR